jgi:uncharacterized membrane protein
MGTLPVPLAVYDQTLRVLRQAVLAAKLGNERLVAIRELDRQARGTTERHAIDFDEHVARERRVADFGGRTV